jgi:hypothetical protein
MTQHIEFQYTPLRQLTQLIRKKSDALIVAALVVPAAANTIAK